MAERLGLYAMKLELEDLGFRTLYPQRYRVIERALKRARGNQKEFLDKIRAQLESGAEEGGDPGPGRSAREASVQHLPQDAAQARTLSEIVDVYGLRIIVDSVDTCYRALGVVHSVYKPMPGRFKDYIAIPRVNGYQSLHTTLFGPNGVPIEVQIRTEDMHRVAESGIAAHWKYKEGELEGSAQQERARKWLSHLVEMQEGGNSEEFIESVKVDLFPDKVYVFTPRGEILRLPRGATVVDFAYAVHTDIGNRCVAAKIDRRLTPLRTVLRNGQTVQIITAKGATPEPVVGQFRGHRQGALGDPPLPEDSAPRRGGRAGQAPAGAGAGRVRAQARRGRSGRAALGADRIRAQGHRRAVRESRAGRAPGAAGGAPPAARRSGSPAAAMAGTAARRSRSRAPKACWSAMRIAAIRCRTIRSWRS